MSMSTTSYELCNGALDGKELFIIEAPKTGVQLQTTWRSAKHAEKTQKAPRFSSANGHGTPWDRPQGRSPLSRGK